MRNEYKKSKEKTTAQNFGGPNVAPCLEKHQKCHFTPCKVKS